MASEDSISNGSAAERITSGLSCLQCGYSLYGQQHDANCPECGFPVETTLTGDLRAQPVTYLRRVRRGLTLILTGYGCWLVLLAALTLAASLLGFSTNANSLDIVAFFVFILMVPTLIWAIVGPLLGWWLASCEVPFIAVMARRGISLRRLLRWLILITAVCAAVTGGVFIAELAAGSSDPSVAFTCLLITLGLLWFVMIFVSLYLLRWWAWSGADVEHIRYGRITCRIVKFAAVTFVLALVVMPVIGTWVPWPMLVGFVAIAAVIAPIVAVAAYVTYLSQVRALVTNALHDAQRSESSDLSEEFHSEAESPDATGN